MSDENKLLVNEARVELQRFHRFIEGVGYKLTEIQEKIARDTILFHVNDEHYSNLELNCGLGSSTIGFLLMLFYIETKPKSSVFMFTHSGRGVEEFLSMVNTTLIRNKFGICNDHYVRYFENGSTLIVQDMKEIYKDNSVRGGYAIDYMFVDGGVDSSRLLSLNRLLSTCKMKMLHLASKPELSLKVKSLQALADTDILNY